MITLNVWKPALVATAVLAGLGACESKEDREKGHLKRATEYYAAKQFAKAEVEYKNALQLNPKNVQARYRLGRIAEEQAKWKSAYRNYLITTEEQPKHLGANLRLARFYMLAGNTEAAQKALDIVLAQAPQNAQALAVQSSVFLRSGRIDRAVKFATQSRKIDKNNLDALSVLVAVNMRRRKPEAALALLDGAIEAEPKSFPPYLMRISVNLALKNRDAVKRDFATLISLKPKNMTYRVAYARTLLRWRDLEEAGNVLRAAVAAAPEDAKLKGLLATVIRNLKDPAKAERTFRDLMASDPSSPVYQMGLASLFLRSARIDKARAVYEDVIKTSKSKDFVSLARVNLARINLAQRKVAEAQKLVDAALKDTPNHEEANLLQAQLEFRAKKYEKVIDRLRSLLRTKPKSFRAKQLLTEAFVASRQLDLAVNTVKSMLSQRQDYAPAQVRLAQIYLLQKRYDTALSEIEKVLEKRPDHQLAVAVKAEILSHKRNFSEATETLKKLLAATTNKPFVYRLLGETYLREGRAGAAIEAFNKAIDLGKRIDARTASQLTAAYVIAKDLTGAENRLLSLQAKFPNRFYLSNLLGEVLARQDKPAAAATAFRKSIALNPKGIAAYLNLARLERAAKNYDKAIATLKTGMAKVEKPLILQMVLAETYGQAAKVSLAIAEYEAILEQQPRLVFALNNHSALIADHRSEDRPALEKALARMKPLERLQTSPVLDTIGWLHYRLGDFSQAVKYLRLAATKAPKVAQIRYHLGMAYYRSGQIGAAEQELERATRVTGDTYPGLKDAQTTLARLKAQKN